MNFAEGLEMLRFEPILDSSLLRGSRATYENVFYMHYLFIYYTVVSQTLFLPQSLLKKQKINNKITFGIFQKKKWEQDLWTVYHTGTLVTEKI